MTRTTNKRTLPAVTPKLDVRVALYLRISSSASSCTQPGWVHVETYEDQVSGAKASRPQLDRALRDAKLGRTTCSSSTESIASPARWMCSSIF